MSLNVTIWDYESKSHHVTLKAKQYRTLQGSWHPWVMAKLWNHPALTQSSDFLQSFSLAWSFLLKILFYIMSLFGRKEAHTWSAGALRGQKRELGPLEYDLRGRELPWRSWEPNLGPMEEEPVLLNTESHLQPVAMSSVCHWQKNLSSEKHRCIPSPKAQTLENICLTQRGSRWDS